MPQFAPQTDIGRTAVQAYAERAGMGVAEYLDQLPFLPLTPEIAGSAVVELVQAEGFTTRSADGLDAARVALAEAPADVVLTDLVLPDGSGLELVDAAAHQLGLYVTFPLGLRLRERLSLAAVDATTCRVQYG